MTNMIVPGDKQDLAVLAKALTPKQRRFADNLFLPATNQEQAAVLAGYAEGSAHVAASRNMRVPAIVAYINACVAQGFQANAIKAAQVVKDISDTAKSEKVRLEASQDILNRAGHNPVEKHAHAVKGELLVNIDLS